jgi:hypothetical protein
MVGTYGYAVYIFGFLIALLSPDIIAWPVFILASMIGGCAGGLLWTAQGDYFTRESQFYALEQDISVEEATGVFAGIFATAYLGIETITKVLATLIFIVADDDGAARAIVFVTYTIFAVISCVGITHISTVGATGSFDNVYRRGWNVIKATDPLNLIRTDSKILYLLPYQMAFGFATSLLIYYIFGTIVADSDDLGESYVGLLSAIIVIVGTFMSIPSGQLSAVIGKSPLMVTGGICFSLMGGTLLMASDSTLGTWGGIIPLLCLQGVGRGIWEATNKATVSDLFGSDKKKTSAAFALISFSNGIATAIGFFTFTSLPRLAMASISLGMGIISIISYLYLVFRVMVVPNDYVTVLDETNSETNSVEGGLKGRI